MAVRLGCLGAAKITPPALVWPSRVCGGVKLQAIAARDGTRAAEFARYHGFARTEADYAALIAANDIDLVYNALPINLHSLWSIRALEAGKDVLCEKPFAMNLSEAEAVLDAAKRSGRRVIEAFHTRYHPGFRQVVEWVWSGVIGEVRSIKSRFDIGVPNSGGTDIRHLPETGGGAMMDLGCYPLSWSLALLGGTPKVREAQATLTAAGVDESMVVALEFASGAVAELGASMAVGRPFVADLSVTGTAGEIVFKNVIAPHHGARLSLTREGKTTVIPVSRLATYAYQLDAVVSALGSGEPLLTEGDAILRQQRTLDAIYGAAGLMHLREFSAK